MTRLSKRIGHYVETKVDGETVVMNIDSGHFFALEGTARSFWSALDRHDRRADIVADLAEQYGTAPAKVDTDLTSFIAELREAGLIIVEDGL